MATPSLKGRSASRYSCPCDESAAISSVMRPASGGEVGFAGSGSGFSRVRARATLQVLAPRSRARGKCRLMSCSARRGSQPERRGTVAAGRGVSGTTHQESLTEPDSHLIFEVVGLPAPLDISCGPLLLQPFRSPVEDLEDGRPGGLGGEASTCPGDRSGELVWADSCKGRIHLWTFTLLLLQKRVWREELLRRRSGVGERTGGSSRRHALYLSTMTFWHFANPRDHRHST